MRRWAWWTLGLAAAVGLAVVAFHVFRDPGEKAFDEYVAALRERGEPTTWEELLGPPVPDEENVVVGVREAWKRLVAARGEPETWTKARSWSAGAKWFQRMSEAEFESTCVRLRPFVDDVAVAADRPYARALEDDLPGKGPSSSWLGGRDGSAAYDAVNVLLAVARADPAPERRLKALRTAFLVGRRLGASGLYDDADSLRHEPLWALERAALVGCAKAADLRAALDDVLADPEVASTEFLLRHARLCALQAHLAERRQAAGVGASIWRRLLVSFTGPTSAPRHGGADVAAWCGRLDVALAATREDRSDFPPIGSLWPDLVGRDGRGWLDRDLFRADEGGAFLTARVALALLAYREEHGDWPAALRDLAPLFPRGAPWGAEDPNEWFRYRGGPEPSLSCKSPRGDWDLAAFARRLAAK